MLTYFRHTFRIGLGLLLLASAYFKIDQSSVPILGRLPFIDSPRVFVAILVLEAIMGLWLLVGSRSRYAWATTFWLMAGMIFVNGYLASVHQPTCGCFGAQVRISPIVMGCIDLIMLIGVVYCYLRIPIGSSTSRGYLILSDSVLAAAFLGFLFLISNLVVATSLAVQHRIEGRGIGLIPDNVINVGLAIQGERRVVKVSVTNKESSPIRLIGGSSSCHCIAHLSLPVTVAPHSSSEFELWVYCGQPGFHLDRFTVTTDHAIYKQITGWVRYRVESPD